jgi:undecaprenyl-diphosphatase
MSELWIAALLGIVEGLTEYIPVSSTGHLIVAGALLGWTGEKAKTFEIFIQLGAILAVVVYYRGRFLELVRPTASERGRFAGLRGCVLLGVTTLPVLALGFLLRDFIKARLFAPAPVAIALAVGDSPSSRRSAGAPSRAPGISTRWSGGRLSGWGCSSACRSGPGCRARRPRWSAE